LSSENSTARMAGAPPEAYVPLFGEEPLYSLTVLANNPPLAKAFYDFSAHVLKEDRTLPDRMMELLRLRIAFHNQCRSCMVMRYLPDDEVSEDLVCSLEKPQEADDLTDAERVVLEFGDKMATDHLSIDDAMYERLREHFDDAQIIEIGRAAALCVGFGRLHATFNLVDDLPDRFREDDVVTPWGDPEGLQRPVIPHLA
jgi:alkylhydroperoxidase family enzyme